MLPFFEAVQACLVFKGAHQEIKTPNRLGIINSSCAQWVRFITLYSLCQDGWSEDLKLLHFRGLAFLGMSAVCLGKLSRQTKQFGCNTTYRIHKAKALMNVYNISATPKLLRQMLSF